MHLMSLSVGICKHDLDLDSYFKEITHQINHPALSVDNPKLNSNNNAEFFKTKKFNVWIPQSIFFPTSFRSIRWLFQVFEEQREAVFVLLGTFRHQRKKNTWVFFFYKFRTKLHFFQIWAHCVLISFSWTWPSLQVQRSISNLYLTLEVKSFSWNQKSTIFFGS